MSGSGSGADRKGARSGPAAGRQPAQASDGSALAPRLAAALAAAVERGTTAAFFDELARGSGLPGTRPNLELAAAVGAELAALRGRADGVVRALLAEELEYPLVVGAMALAARWRGGIDPRGAVRGLHDLAGDPRALVRVGVVHAVRAVLAAGGDAALAELATFTDGYLHAHVALEAIADRDLLTRLRSGEDVLARLDEAFALADAAPRSADRSQGLRTLRRALPGQIATIAARFPEVVGWLADRAAAKRPETREVVADAIASLRRASLPEAEAARLRGLLEASAKPPRDPSRIVQGTRRRGKGRR